MRSLGVNGYPSFSTQNQGFFQRHMRRISSNLPRFNHAHPQGYYYGEKDKPASGWRALERLPLVGRLQRLLSRLGRKAKLRLLFLFSILLFIYVFYHSRQ